MGETTVFDCGLLIDGVTDEPVQEALVLVEDGRVSEVGPREAVDVPGNASRVDCSDQFVVPGFIDLHLHLNGARSFAPMEKISTSVAAKTARAAADLSPLVESGFTSVRDLGSVAGLGLRDAVNEGELAGPRIFTAGRAFSQTGGHADIHSLPHSWIQGNDQLMGLVADGVDECRKEVRKQLRRGVDCVKIMTSGGMSSERDNPTDYHYTAEEIRAFTEEAHRVGVPVAAHANGDAGAAIALENGVDTVEHAIGITDETIELALQRDATIVTTLSAIYRLANEGGEHGLPEYHVQKGKDHVDLHADSIRRAYEGGVPIALGTDCNGSTLHPHGDNAIEFELLVQQAELSELDAIKAGTSNAARGLPVDDVGALTEGNRADLVVLDENPLDDISATREEVAAVYKGGELVSG